MDSIYERDGVCNHMSLAIVIGGYHEEFWSMLFFSLSRHFLDDILSMLITELSGFRGCNEDSRNNKKYFELEDE